MQAILTVFDDPAREQIENIWGELKAVFGLPSLRGSVPPHLTYQRADDYQAPAIDGLRRIAAATAAFDVGTHGLGAFHGDEVGIYLHVTPSAALRDLHARLWRELAPLGAAVRDAYAPPTWLPHITIASGRLTDTELDATMRFLARRDYEWTLPITNIAVAEGVDSSTWRRCDLRSAH